MTRLTRVLYNYQNLNIAAVMLVNQYGERKHLFELFTARTLERLSRSNANLPAKFNYPRRTDIIEDRSYTRNHRREG